MVCAIRVRHHSPKWHMERLVRGQMVLFILAPACGMLVILSTASSRKLGRNKQRAPEPRERRITPPNRAPVDKQSTERLLKFICAALAVEPQAFAKLYRVEEWRPVQVEVIRLARDLSSAHSAPEPVTPSRWSATSYIAWQQRSRAASACPQSPTREQAARA